MSVTALINNYKVNFTPEQDIETAILARKALAREFRLFQKCRLIASEIPTKTEPKQHGAYEVFERLVSIPIKEDIDHSFKLTICSDTYHPNLWLEVNGCNVATYHSGELMRFLPAEDFLKAINVFYSEALEEQAKREAEKKKELLEAKRQDWGLVNG